MKNQAFVISTGSHILEMPLFSSHPNISFSSIVSMAVDFLFSSLNRKKEEL